MVTETLPVHRLLLEGRQERRRKPANRDKVLPSPRAASLLSEVGGASAPWKCAFWQLPRPSPIPLSKGSMQKGAIWSFVDTFSLVQYLSGVNAGPGSPESSVPPLPLLPHSPQSAQRVEGCGDQAHQVGEPCRVRVSMESFSNTHPHAHTENEVKSNVSKSDPFLV